MADMTKFTLTCPKCGSTNFEAPSSNLGTDAPLKCLQCGTTVTIAEQMTKMGSSMGGAVAAAVLKGLSRAQESGNAPAAAPVASAPAAAPTALACPTCHSTDVRRASMIYKEGTSDGSFTTQSTGYTRPGMWGFAVPQSNTRTTSTTSGVQQSRLASEMAPPGKKVSVAGGLLIFFGVPLILFALVGQSWVGVGIGTALFIGGRVLWTRATKWNKEELPKLITQWQSQFVCLRCGARFDPPQID